MAGIRHVVTLTMNADATHDQVADIVDRLRELPAAIPEIAAYCVGADLGLAAGNASIAVVADFASVADYEVYRDHPVHQAVIADHIRPVLAGRSAVQLEF